MLSSVRLIYWKNKMDGYCTGVTISESYLTQRVVQFLNDYMSHGNN